MSYNSAFIEKVIVYAEEHENRATGRKFNINEVNIFRWRNNRNALFSCKATTKRAMDQMNLKKGDIQK